jgi:hypothetical protein
VALRGWFAEETERIHAVLSEPATECPARRLVEFVRRRGGRMNVRDFQKAIRRDYRYAAETEVALGDLLDRGIARWVAEDSPKGALVGQDSDDSGEVNVNSTWTIGDVTIRGE